MRLEEKKKAVDELAEKVQSASVIISTDYGGLTVAEMTDLRRKLRAQQVEFRVIKNTLARFAATKAGKEDLDKIIAGPTAVALGYDDIAAPAKILLEYIRSTKSQLKISGGLIENRVLSAAEVATLATMPPKEVLVAKLLGNLKGPLYGLVNVLNANIAGLTYVLSARQKQLEKGG
ncbi:MAG: 50S ribosomal protein L10 [Dehalococcoidia bacterium]|jgi:large subunit ribosomal protein L10